MQTIMPVSRHIKREKKYLGSRKISGTSFNLLWLANINVCVSIQYIIKGIKQMCQWVVSVTRARELLSAYFFTKTLKQACSLLPVHKSEGRAHSRWLRSAGAVFVFYCTVASINTVPLSNLKLYAKKHTCFRFVRECSSGKPEIFVLGLFCHLIGCLAYYLAVELFHVEK